MTKRNKNYLSKLMKLGFDELTARQRKRLYELQGECALDDQKQREEVEAEEGRRQYDLEFEANQVCRQRLGIDLSMAYDQGYSLSDFITTVV